MLLTVCKNGDEEYLAAMRNRHIEVLSIKTCERLLVVDLDIDDWSVHHGGLGLEQRHLVNNKHSYIYAAQRSHKYVICHIKDKTQSHTVEVFKPYVYNKSSTQPDFAPNNVDHISALTVSGDGTVVVIGNGATGNIQLHSFDQGQLLTLVEGHKGPRMKNFFFPPKCHWFYMTLRNLVGTVDLQTGASKLMLPHPSRVCKVMGIDNNLVVTIGEDNVLSIWDKNIQPYQQNLSWLTGKVNVSSSAEAEKTINTFNTMLARMADDHSLSNLPDTRSLLTTEKMYNYWSDDVLDADEERADIKVKTVFHPFKDSRYVGVSQNNVKGTFTYCFTVWEAAAVNCIRRVFLPAQEVLVHAVVNDNSILVSEDGLLKIISINENKVTRVFDSAGQTYDKRCVLYLPKRNGKSFFS